MIQLTLQAGGTGVAIAGNGTARVTVSGTLSFSVCTEDKCLIEKRALSVGVDVD